MCASSTPGAGGGASSAGDGIVGLLQVVGLEEVCIADINAGGWHSLALTTNGGA